ncbi:lipopolysaccharide biosynthesis protein [Streptococcus ictaluri]|uniref:Polysaccharide biosynthesis protein n=1 Tax=Streptococcus ictaluri 707-05 TaxID=764299 RepID=G5K3V6_9STRE|nr:lipopolysaccharide biosynthesis protein [Streptococcus ictaluri]EHI69348.1 polysaccharide biosynthesis protein [Streptococcus ictaluri 707-05]
MINSQNQAQRSFIWNMLGSISAAAISVVLLMVVTRFLSPIDSDIYAFAYSFANMMVVVALFQVRNYQATDIDEKYSFSQYLMARLVTCLIMLLISIAYLTVTKTDAYKSYVILLVCFYRLTDAFSDLYQGMFQQHERLDIAGKSLTFRNSFIFLIYTLSILYFKDLVLALEIVCLFSATFVLFYDIRKSKQFHYLDIKEVFHTKTFKASINLLKESFPLFLNGFLIIYIYTQPKYSIEIMTNLGKIPLGSQTIFNILFMPAFVMNLMMLFFRPHITQMAIALLKGQLKLFSQIQVRLFTYLALFGCLVLIGSAFLGLPFLSILYATDLKEYWLAFMFIMLGGAIGSFATAIDNILTAMRKQQYLVIPYLGGFLFSLTLTNPLVASYNILGAALSFILTMLFWCFLSIMVYWIVMRRFKKGNSI